MAVERRATHRRSFGDVRDRDAFENHVVFFEQFDKRFVYERAGFQASRVVANVVHRRIGFL